MQSGTDDGRLRRAILARIYALDWPKHTHVFKATRTQTSSPSEAANQYCKTPPRMESPPLVASIRRCLYRDLDRILPIYNHYVTQTIASFDLDVKPVAYMQRLYNSVLDQDLPFLVVTSKNDQKLAPNKEDILGYGYAHFYRRLPAFGGTVEILIYVDPSATGQGIGKTLLEVLIDMLKAVPPGTDRDHGIREVLAIVPVDDGRDASPFFTKFGFEDRGTCKRVGWKMGRWIDTRTLQRSLVRQPQMEGKAEQEKRRPERRWWSSLFRRRRRLRG